MTITNFLELIERAYKLKYKLDSSTYKMKDCENVKDTELIEEFNKIFRMINYKKV